MTSRVVLPAEGLATGPTALRAWRDADVPALVTACQDPEIVRWTRVPKRYGQAEAYAYLHARHDDEDGLGRLGAVAAGRRQPHERVHRGAHLREITENGHLVALRAVRDDQLGMVHCSLRCSLGSVTSNGAPLWGHLAALTSRLVPARKDD